MERLTRLLDENFPQSKRSIILEIQLAACRANIALNAMHKKYNDQYDYTEHQLQWIIGSVAADAIEIYANALANKEPAEDVSAVSSEAGFEVLVGPCGSGIQLEILMHLTGKV